LGKAIIFDASAQILLMEHTPPPAQVHAGEAGFETLFKAHFRALHAYACTIIKDEAAAEDIVQNTFFKLWERRDQLQILQSVTAYLYRAVYHESLNYLKHAKVKKNHQHYVTSRPEQQESPAGHTAMRELESRLEAALRELPEQCRTIFQKSRFEELKYREIAVQMGLSVKTVENQMGKALRLLRLKLADFLPALLVIAHCLNQLL
jgi:RNA polymerase sigma-70 factor (ECF subfamily)